jgi:phosphate transport system protein
MCKRPELSEVHMVEPLYHLADRLLQDGLLAFVDGRPDLGASLRERDKELDRQHKRVVAMLSGLLEEANGRCEDYLHLIFIARSLERIGDLAVNIGEDAVFLELARDIRRTGKGRTAPEPPGAAEQGEPVAESGRGEPGPDRPE